MFYHPPSLSSFFVGRDEERRNLLRILERYGSAAITQYGGAGKTQLMVSFAEYAHDQGLVSGGIFWVIADGSKEKVLSSFVDFVQRLGQFALPERDKSCTRAVVSSLRRAFAEVEGRWLLCVDNADCAETAEILGDVAKLAEPNCGWLLVTSRRGAPGLWPGMTDSQLLRLEPLSQEDAMSVLWRWGKAKPRDLEDDAQVFSDIDRLKYEDKAEYRALADLAGVDHNHGLARLPLALVQAGSFIRSAALSFYDYFKMFQDERNDLPQMLETAMDSGLVRNEQKAIWTTWRVSMDALDEISRRTIRAVAMLGVGDVPKCLMRRLVNECVTDRSESDESNLLFHRVVRRKLVNGSSLLTEETKRGSFSLHPLIRQYVRFDASPTAAALSGHCVACCARNDSAGSSRATVYCRSIGRGENTRGFGGFTTCGRCCAGSG